MRPETRSDLLSVATETDRTIYFDLLPLNLGTISGMKFMVRLFTVPGQVYYSETRKLVLKGADGVVFVADSQDHMMDENRQSLADLKTNLSANGLDYATIPLVMQWNKRDLPQLISEAELDATLNERSVKAIPAIAAKGNGVLETLRAVTLSVFNHIKSGGRTSAPPPARSAATRTPTASAPTGSPPRASAGTGSLPAPQPGARAQPRPAPATGSRPSSDLAQTSSRIDGPQPVKMDAKLLLEEFQNLALVNSELSERMTRLENEVRRLGSENQEIRELLTRQR
jgi:signal recognition particle receptor subunit beta